MDHIGKLWQSVPATVRKPIVFIVGLPFILAAGATGWLPGPGGIPLFLIGIAILATEFAWAARVRDGVLARVEQAGLWLRRHSTIGPLLLATGTWTALGVAYAFFS